MATTDLRPRTTADQPITSAARAIDLVKTYGKGDAAVNAVGGIIVDFESGSLTAVMGPSGSGKSTLMHCPGLDSPTSGRALVGERDIGRLDDGELTEMRFPQYRGKASS